MITRSPALRAGNGRTSAIRSGAFYAGQRFATGAGFPVCNTVSVVGPAYRFGSGSHFQANRTFRMQSPAARKPL